MTEDNALVRNAADPEQVKQAGKDAKFARKQELQDMRDVLDTPQGRRLLWRLITHCRVFGTIWEPSAKIHYNAGLQDVGHFMQAEIIQASSPGYLLMQEEAMKGERKDV